MQGNRKPRKYGQFLLKVWSPSGDRFEIKSTKDLTKEEFVKNCDLLIKMLARERDAAAEVG